jgi:hypothetical protein
MIVCIEGVAMPWKRQGPRRIRDVDIFAYCREERPGEHGDGSVQSANHALHLVKIVTSRNMIEAEPPRTPDHEPMFLIEIQVFGVHRDTASYRVAYQKFAGCPMHIIEYMMDYYARIKRVVRKVNKETKLEREFRLKRRRNGAA